MGEKTEIEWTSATVNFWWGCQKVSPGCANCYADREATRYGKSIFGPAATTDRELKIGPWKEILKWDRQAKVEGVRRHVFAQSMSDFFEDHPQVMEWREKAKRILESLEWLDVQLLTKRPENVPSMAPEWMANWPSHIWMGTSVEDQKRADERIPELLDIPATIRFLSVEPLLGPVNLTDIQYGLETRIDALTGVRWQEGRPRIPGIKGINWVIVGGESGPKARPMKKEWVLRLRDDCVAAGVPFFFKQWGEWIQGEGPIPSDSYSGGAYISYPGSHGTAISVYDKPTHLHRKIDDAYFYRIGKKDAGRLLEGREWSEFPEVTYA